MKPFTYQVTFQKADGEIVIQSMSHSCEIRPDVAYGVVRSGQSGKVAYGMSCLSVEAR